MSAEGDETTEMMEATKTWAPLMCFDFMRVRSDIAQKRTSNSVDTGTFKGRYIRSEDGKWVKGEKTHAKESVHRI